MRPLLYNIDYEAASLIFLIILSFYLKKHYYDSMRINKALRRVAHAEEILITLDIISTITLTYIEFVPLQVNYILNAAYYSLLGMATFCTMLFIESFAPERINFKKFNKINLIIYSIYVAINIIGVFTRWVFYIEDYKFLHGPLYLIVYIYPGVLILEGIIIFIIHSSEMKKVQRTVIVCLLIFSAVGPALKLFFFPNYLLSNVSPALALFACLFTVVSPNYHELTEKKKELEIARTSLEKQVIERTAKAREKESRSSELADEIIEAMKTMIDESNTNRENHSDNVSRLSVLIAKEMGLSKANQKKLYSMAVVHDIGIIGIDEEVALKIGKYTDAERKEMQRHTEIGEEILKSVTEMPELAVMARSHHERYDGKGYPDHLKGNEIPLFARIIAVADSYDAMTERRPYREVFTKEHVIEEFKRCSGKQYDPKIVRALLHVLEKNEYTPAGE